MKIVRSFLILALLLVTTSKSFACICSITPPPCFNFSQSEAVFVGTIKTVEAVAINPRVTVEVNQNFKGMDRKTAFTTNPGHSCARTFQPGGKYLFYVSLGENDRSFFSDNYCTGTKLYSDDLDDLEFLNSAKSSKPSYWVWGTIGTGFMSFNPLKGIKAEVYDNKKKLVGVSNDAGNIRIAVSKEGKYTVRLPVLKGFEVYPYNITNSPYWEYWQSIYRYTRKIGNKRFFEFQVEVKAGHCGWFHMEFNKEIKNK
jgi:hypothetical protein